MPLNKETEPILIKIIYTQLYGLGLIPLRKVRTSLSPPQLWVKYNHFCLYSTTTTTTTTTDRIIGLVGRVFANGLGDLGSIPGRIIPKTLKMVLDTSLLNT